MRRLFSIPEVSLLIIIGVLGYISMLLFSQVGDADVLTATQVWYIVFGSFIASTLIAILAVIVGVGGGVMYTPILLAFTSLDSLIVRSTGLVVAMFSGLVSSGPFMKKGMSDIRIVFFCSIPIILGGMAGSNSAIYVSSVLGATGDALVNIGLGLLLVFIATLFVTGGAKKEYPEQKPFVGLSKICNLQSSYWEESLNKVVSYRVARALPGLFLFFGVGFTGGFFGLGGGWAVVPVMNLVMTVPLKVSAACSGVLLAMGNAAAIWPYIISGSLIAVFAFPWMLGQVIGGIIGAHILVKIQAGVVRNILIVILFINSIKLISKGIEVLFNVDIPIF